MTSLETAILAARRHTVEKRSLFGNPLKEALKAKQEEYAASINDQVSRDALKNALRWIGVGGASGVALRGLQGLVEQPRRNLRKPVHGLSVPEFVDIPIAKRDEKKANFLEDLKKGVAEKAREGVKWTAEALTGQHATEPTAKSFWMPMAFGGGALAGLGGYKLHDLMIDKMRRDQLDTELSQAKGEYEQALLPKQAGENGLSSDLDSLYAEMCKCAADNAENTSWEDATEWGNRFGRLGGAYGLFALLSGALGAGASYNHFKKKQRRSLLESAQEKRRREQFQKSPTPLYARPLNLELLPTAGKAKPTKAAPSLTARED